MSDENVRKKSDKKKIKNKNSTNLKNLEEKRRKEREKKRRQREKIYQNPEAHEQAKRKERKYYQKRKKEGKIKAINQKTPREQRLQRKKWKENIKNYRARKIQMKNAILQENTTSTSSFLQSTPSTSSFLHSTPSTSLDKETPKLQKYQSSKMAAGRKKVRRDRAKAHRECQKLIAKFKKQKAKTEKYRKKYQRLMKAKNCSPTKRKKVLAVMNQGKNAIKKRLLFGEALEAQLINKSKSLKCLKEKQIFSKCLSGTILKKYQVSRQAKRFLNSYQHRKNLESASLKYFRKKKSNALQEQVKQAVIDFFEKDENTCIAPSKRDFITQNKVKKQKRYLLHSMGRLHKLFLESSQFKLSYVSFTRLKPFWIVKPKVCGRDTCLCIKHENFKYMIVKLHQMKVLSQSSIQDLCASVCCSTKEKECMYGQCRRCNHKEIKIRDIRNDEEIFYYQWMNKREDRICKGEKFEVKFVNKEKIVCTVEELVNRTNEALPFFLKHVYNASHQLVKCKQLKENLRTNEVLILIDFSENYSCKYEREVQSVHFGAAKKQLTLHTGVVYYNKKDSRVQEDGDATINCISFCSVSESLQHNACSTWAHLQPVLNMIKLEFPQVDTLHFQSDGPTTQYRNKTNFFLFHHFCSKLALKAASWNFTEAGHGKSSADGIVGVTKRIADQEVAYGKDIYDAATFISALNQHKELKVQLFTVTDSDIKEIESILPRKLQLISNIMKLHQLVWNEENKSVLGL